MSAMNGFRLTGDALHVLAILLLLFRLFWTKSCEGISARSQILFALVYTTRYADLAMETSLYNLSMKFFFVVCSYVIVLLITYVYSKTYEHKKDVFLSEFLVIPCLMISLYFNHQFTAQEILWTFSIYLEALAILPQFYMIHKRKQISRSLLYYLAALGTYRAFYIFNWLYLYYTESHYDVIADGGGLLYTFLYAMGASEVIFNGIKITNDEKGALLKSNISFVRTNGLLEDRLNLTNEEQDIEKNSLVYPPELEKF